MVFGTRSNSGMEVVIDYWSRLFGSEREFGMCGPRVAVLAILSVRAR